MPVRPYGLTGTACGRLSVALWWGGPSFFAAKRERAFLSSFPPSLPSPARFYQEKREGCGANRPSRHTANLLCLLKWFVQFVLQGIRRWSLTGIDSNANSFLLPDKQSSPSGRFGQEGFRGGITPWGFGGRCGGRARRGCLGSSFFCCEQQCPRLSCGAGFWGDVQMRAAVRVTENICRA